MVLCLLLIVLSRLSKMTLQIYLVHPFGVLQAGILVWVEHESLDEALPTLYVLMSQLS